MNIEKILQYNITSDDGQEICLFEEEAKRLYDELHKVFGPPQYPKIGVHSDASTFSFKQPPDGWLNNEPVYGSSGEQELE